VGLRRKVDDGGNLLLLQDVGDQFPVADIAPVEPGPVTARRQAGQVAGVGELVQNCHHVSTLHCQAHKGTADESCSTRY